MSFFFSFLGLFLSFSSEESNVSYQRSALIDCMFYPWEKLSDGRICHTLGSLIIALSIKSELLLISMFLCLKKTRSLDTMGTKNMEVKMSFRLLAHSTGRLLFHPRNNRDVSIWLTAPIILLLISDWRLNPCTGLTLRSHEANWRHCKHALILV